MHVILLIRKPLYYLGIAYDGLGEARERHGLSYEESQRFASFRAAAALRLGEMLARDGDLDEAERQSQRKLYMPRPTTPVHWRNWLR